MPSQGIFLEGLLEPYLESRSLHLVPSSLAQERRHLGRFLASLRGQGVQEVGAVLEGHVARYHAEQRLLSNREGKALSDSFFQQAILAVRGFLLWAHREGLVLWDFGGLSIPKRVDKIRRVPTVEEMRRLLELPDVGDPVGVRDRLLLELLYVLGLRVGECRKLDLSSVDLAARTLAVVGKGGHERLLPLSPKVLESLLRYLDFGRPCLEKVAEERALFLARTFGRRLSGQSILLRVRRYGAKLGLKLAAHQLRHACATHLLEGGAEPPYIARLLGHEDLTSTMRYARVRPLALKKEHRRCHPRALGGLDD